jgi:hypothetical protein
MVESRSATPIEISAQRSIAEFNKLRTFGIGQSLDIGLETIRISIAFDDAVAGQHLARHRLDFLIISSGSQLALAALADCRLTGEKTAEHQVEPTLTRWRAPWRRAASFAPLFTSLWTGLAIQNRSRCN